MDVDRPAFACGVRRVGTSVSRSERSLCYRCGSRIETVVTVVMWCHVTYAGTRVNVSGWVCPHRTNDPRISRSVQSIERSLYVRVSHHDLRAR
jgi:hypothetical protein